MKIILALLVGLTYLGAATLESRINACKNANAKACYEAGMTLTTGENTEDQEKRTLGREYIRKACVYGVSEACDTMGDNYYIDKHYQAAKPYLKKSCENGKMTACEAIGTMYRDAQEIKQDDVKAREYYEKACVLGSKDACINVAIIYRGGFGVKKDRALEKMFYKKSCDLKSKAGCDMYTKMDNKDKGIEELGFFDSIFNFFK